MDGSPPIARTLSREGLMDVLYEAAKLEQNLMCTYLYAASSLKDGKEGLEPAEAIAVAQWRRTIIDIAIDKMSHLVAVWNVTSALGGPPRFGRANFPIEPGDLPVGIELRLAPFGEGVLQHFVHLERPQGSDEPDGPGFAAERADLETIGQFRASIAASLRAFCEMVGEDVAFIGDHALQLSSAEVALAGATPVVDLTSALAVLGAVGDEDSHFRRFMAIRDEAAALAARNAAFVPAHPSACNPVLRKPPRPDGLVWLENAEAIATVELANAIYGLMLRLLAGAYVLPGPHPDKTLYIETAIGLMRGLTPLAERAARLPAGPSNPRDNAGVSFTALRDVAALPPGRSALRFYVERIEEISGAAADMDRNDVRCVRANVILRALAGRLRDAFLAIEEDAPEVPKTQVYQRLA